MAPGRSASVTNALLTATHRLWSIALLLLCVCGRDFPTAVWGQDLPPLESYANSLELDPDNVFLYWSFDVTSRSIHFALKAKTSGWLALGISEVGAMIGSDVMLGWVANGSAVMTDRFIFNKSRDATGVALDSQQDVHIVAGQETYNLTTGDTWTTLHFWRLLNTSDCNDRVIQSGEHVALIWALGSTDTPSYHGLSRGGKTVVLYPGELFGFGRQVPPDPVTPASGLTKATVLPAKRSMLARKPLPTSTASHFAQISAPSTSNPATLVATDEWLNLTTNNYIIPTNFTSYICNTFNITTYTTKKHAVEFGIIINTPHPETLHHAVVYGCLETDNIQSYDPNYACYSQAGCSNYFAVWAVGGNPVVIPTQAGLPVGLGGYKTLVLQIHYTNPEGLPGVVDNSGMYFKISPTLREFDAGILETGSPDFVVDLFIPPGQPVWTQETIYPAECSNKLANTSDGATRSNITIFASMMHQHTIGKQLVVDLYRDGQKILSAGRQDYYDFAYQQFKDLSPGFYLLPGDELRARCVWDSSNRTTVTPGGFSTVQEMCYGYLYYYPIRQSFVGPCFSFCASANSMETGWPWFNSSAPLVAFAQCAKSIVYLPNRTCPASFEANYGTNSIPFEVLAGCPASLVPSLSSLNLTDLSVLATPGVPVPGSTGPQTNCVASSATGEVLSFSQCTTLDGGFSLMWTVVSENSMATKLSTETSNITLVLRVSGSSEGYLGFGFSPQGGMIGSSAFAGWLSSSGPLVDPLYLGGFSPSLVTVGNNLLLLGSRLETGAGKVTFYANISMPLSMCTSPQKTVWSKGLVVNNFVSQHLASDAHMGTLTVLDCTSPSAAANCGALGINSTSPTQGKSAEHLISSYLLIIFAFFMALGIFL